MADPVVYKLVRVDTDGRLIPATDDELMEVEDLLENEKDEALSHDDAVQTMDLCPYKEKLPVKSLLEGYGGLLQIDKAEVAEERLNARLEYIEEMLQKVNEEERHHLECESPIHSSACMDIENVTSDPCDRFLNSCERPQSGIPLLETSSILSPSSNSRADSKSEQSVKLKNLGKEVTGNLASASALASSKPDFSRLKGELNLDKLTIKELQDTFRAAFGRKTFVKDKQWLKRRIAMGLTNSCDVPLTSFIIKDKKIVKEDREESLAVADPEDPVAGVVIDCGKELLGINENQMGDVTVEIKQRNSSLGYDNNDHSNDHGAFKRVRKPTRRYIEELSDTGPGEHCGRFISPVKWSGQVNVASKSTFTPAKRPRQVDGSSDSTINPPPTSNPVVTRRDSLGGAGVQVPCASRMRRCRPRKSIMALTRFQPSGTGMTTKWVENPLDRCNFQLSEASEDTMLEVGGCNSQLDKASDHKILEVEDSISLPEKVSEEDNILEVIPAPPKDLLVIGEKGDKELAITCNPGIHQDQEPNRMDSSSNDLDEMTNSTPKVGIRRKHHRAWTLTEVVKLVDGVAKFGAGRWSEIKRLSFASVLYRTPVDLKDKWRNLLKASFAVMPSDAGAAPRKNVSVPLPEPILLKVRDLAKLNGHLPKKLKSCSEASLDNNGRPYVNQDRSGYL
ncbi:hypothetical protein Dimus_027500 [Dionaea muscipula]